MKTNVIIQIVKELLSNSLLIELLKSETTSNMFLSIASNLISTKLYNSLQNFRAKDVIQKSFDKAIKKYNQDHGTSLNIQLKDIQESDSYLKNNDFLSCFAAELRKTTSGYLYLIERKLNDINHNNDIASLLKIDERYSYDEKSVAFFEIFPKSGIAIKDLYIEPQYKILTLNEDGNGITSEKKYNDVFISSCKHLLNESRFLFISAPYGHGKTFLTKQLLAEITDGISLYIYASNLPTDNYTFLQTFNDYAINYFINRYEKLYIFIDSFEDILIEKDINIYDHIATLLNSFPNIFFIVNCRTSEGLSPSEIYEYVKVYLKTEKVVELCSFDNPKITEWINSYSRAIEGKRQKHITIEDINKANKNLRSSFRNPLLLLIMSLNNINSENANLQEWYKYFENFVNQTVKGKFSSELKANNFLRKKGAENKYKVFITKAAQIILKASNKQFDIDKFHQEDYFLDPNVDTSYWISDKEIDKELKVLFNISEKDLQCENVRYLNCYFFECKTIAQTNYWKFRDNNILFFLCAQRFCNCLDNVHKICMSSINDSDIDITNEKTKAINTLLECAKEIPLHPVIIEFILDYIKNSTEEASIKESSRIGIIYTLIQDKIILTLSEKNDFFLDYNKIKIDILFFIIYARYNKFPYCNSFDAFLFKRVSQYYSFVKNIDKDLASVIRRYFNHITIVDAHLNGINIKKYNWSFSRFTNVQFYRCKIEDTLLFRNYFKETEFNLCFFKGIKFNEMGGNIQFRSSELYKTAFIIAERDIFEYKYKNPQIEFRNCVIDDVEIQSRSTFPEVSFINCDIRQIHFNCKHVKLRIENSSFSAPIDLNQTHLTIDRFSTICMYNNGVFLYNDSYYRDRKLNMDDIDILFKKDQSSTTIKEPQPDNDIV